MLLAAKRGEYSISFVAGENRAPRAYHAGRVQILRMVLDVEQNYLLGDPVEDMLRAPAAAPAKLGILSVRKMLKMLMFEL